jgi:magnesium transporter
MQTLKGKSLSWHHFFRPSTADLIHLERQFKLHPSIINDLAHPTMRPKVEDYDDYLYLVLHFPIFSLQDRKTYTREVDFILTKHELISVSNEAIPPLDDFFKKCSTDKSYEDLYASKTPGHLLFHTLKEIYSFALRELDHIQEDINEVEEKVFSSEREEEKVIEQLSFIRRNIIEFRRSLKPQQTTLESLPHYGSKFYGHDVGPFLLELSGEYMKIWNLLENHREAIDALYDNNVTMLSIKQNESMRILSIMAFVTFPLVLFASLFGMNAIATPIIGYKYDFWIIVGIMLLATFGMFRFFKRKRWL